MTTGKALQIGAFIRIDALSRYTKDNMNVQRTGFLSYIFIIAVSLLLFFYSCKEKVNQASGSLPNLIDSVTSEEQISHILYSQDKMYSNFKVNTNLKFPDAAYKRISDSLNVKPWVKGDFDHNGLTDVLVMGDYNSDALICILAKGDNKYDVKSIVGPHQPILPVVRKTKESLDVIRYYYFKEQEYANWMIPRELVAKDLVYKFGNFIEVSEHPNAHNIQKIEYETSGCFGTCPIFSLTIHSDRTALWYPDQFNKIHDKKMKGLFKTRITRDKFTEIIDLLNYIHFETLNDEYAVGWTDDQTGTIKITYDNGKTKNIQDYGLNGTLGLRKLHELLFDLRENQVWTQ
jgi:hypothetical protein